MRRSLALLVTLALTGSAHAFVRSTTNAGVPVWWYGDCVFLALDNSTPSPDLPFATVQSVLAKSIANWQTPTLGAGCSYLVINIDAPAALEAKLDEQNVVKFRTDKWCRPAEPNNPEMCYSQQAAAITTVFYASDGAENGRILDADIELNSIDFTFATLPTTTLPRTGTAVTDLENTLTHELGHLQGLDHSCWDHSSSLHPIDNTGAPIPDCADVLSHRVSDAVYRAVTESTMFNYANPGETIKRMPKPDDIAGPCDIYPKAKDPGVCVRDGQPAGGCCNNNNALPNGASMLLVFLIAAPFLRRKRA